MSDPIRRHATYEELLAVPEPLVAEILAGDLVTHPRPGPKHSLASSFLGDELVGPFGKGRGGPDGWWILDEPELHLGPDVLVPVLAGWRRDRMPELQDNTAWFELSPDWVCEVLSAATARTDRVVKLPLYAKYGVTHLWLIDPDLRTLEAFELKDGRWLLLSVPTKEDAVSMPPFGAIAFSLSVLWP